MVLKFLILFLASATATPAQTPPATPKAIGSSKTSVQPTIPEDEVTPPILVGDENCSYPTFALRLNQEGRTTVTVHVNPKGTVGYVTVKTQSGRDALDNAAVTCAKAWTFRPATRNGTPVWGTVDRTLCWSLQGGGCPPPIPFHPPGPPTGWEVDSATPISGGILASYKLSSAGGAEQYLSAAAYSNFLKLDDYVAKNDELWQNSKYIHILRKEQITDCGNEVVSEIEYTQSGLVAAAPDSTLNVEQVRAVKGEWAYVTTYIRPAQSSKRPEAEQWIYNAICESGG